MNLSELINEIVSDWAYRVNDGMPDAKNPIHVKELSIVLNEMGLSHIKDTLIENLLTEKGKTPEKIKEADKNFTNPILNKKVNYKAKDGSDKEGIVGNLLRQPEGTPARDAAEKMLPPEGSEERDSLNKELGGEGQPKKPEDGKDKAGGEEGGAPKEDPIKAAAHMFDPKVDPAMASRLDKEKAANDKLVQKDKEASDREAELSKKDEPTNEFTPIDVQDVAKEMPGADPETFNGSSDIPDAIDPKELEQFNTDINKVAQQVADAKAKGEPAPNINLCDVTVPGTNLYCDDNLGIPRDEMPQFKGNASPGSRAAGMEADASGEVDTEPVFREMLAQKGIKTLQTEVPADKLKATQKDLVGAKVVGMMGALEKDPNHPKITAPIYVSRDGYVIDGHHRWAAVVAYNAQNPDKQIQMKTTVLDQDIKDAIPMANKFAEDMGIAAKKADANKEAPSTPTSVGKNGLTDKIKSKIQNWTKEEKAFFEKNEGAPGSEMRRSLGEALKDKAAGAWKAIKKGAKHEVEEFKAAGEGVGKFFKGEKLSHHEKDALKAVAIKVVTTAVFGAAMGGLGHGVAAFGKHVAMEFIPHVVGETILKGAGRAALFADMEGEAEMDANMAKFAEMIAKGLEEMEISPEMMEQMVDSYNKKKEENPQKEMTEENLQLAHELMLEMIYGFIDEATYPKADDGKFWVKNKKSGEVYTVAVPKAASHSVPTPAQIKKAAADDITKSAKPAVTPATTKKEPVAGADLFKDKDAKARLDKEKNTNKATTSPNLDKLKASSSYQRGMKALNPAQKKIANELVNDINSFYAETNDAKKAELAKQMIEKYKLSGSNNKQKLYIGVFDFNQEAKKMLGIGSTAAIILNDLEKASNVKLGGSEASGAKVSALLGDSAKPDLTDKSKAKDDPLVAGIFKTEPLSYLEGKFYELHGPLGSDGKLIGRAGGKNSKIYFQHSVSKNKALDKTIELLKILESQGKVKPGLRKVVEEHKAELQRIANEMPIPSKKASDAVAASYSKVAQSLVENSDKQVANSIMKQWAEMALYDTETAAGDECYLPSAGNFPSGDKIKITRKGTKIEKVASVSVKYGSTGKFGNFGFPGECAQYQNYHPNPEYRDRNNSHPGVSGYSLGIKDNLIDDKKQFMKMLKESGMAKHLKNPKDIDAFYSLIQDAKSSIEKLRKKHNVNSFKDLVPHLKEVKAVNEKFAKSMQKLFNIDSFVKQYGKDNSAALLGGPMNLMTGMCFAATLNTSNGLNSIEHNHQLIDDKGVYHSSTDAGSPDLKLWKLSFRGYDERGGGMITSYNSARKDME